MKLTRKKFDCVEMKRKGAAEVYSLVKNMTRAEELAFWRSQEGADGAKATARRTRKARAVRRKK